MRLLNALWIAVLCVLAFPGAAHAQSVNITLNNGAVSGNPGDSFTINGNIQNTGGVDVDINGSLLNVTGPITGDDSIFLVNAPFSVAVAANSGDFDMFTLSINPGATPGVYAGTFQILGRESGTGGPDIVLGVVAFQVTVLGAGLGSNVPEGGSLALLLGGAPVAGCLYWRRRWGSQEAVEEEDLEPEPLLV